MPPNPWTQSKLYISPYTRQVKCKVLLPKEFQTPGLRTSPVRRLHHVSSEPSISFVQRRKSVTERRQRRGYRTPAPGEAAAEGLVRAARRRAPGRLFDTTR